LTFRFRHANALCLTLCLTLRISLLCNFYLAFLYFPSLFPRFFSWTSPGFDDTSWFAASAAKPFGFELLPKVTMPLNITTGVTPPVVITVSPTMFFFDFETEIMAGIRIDVPEGAVKTKCVFYSCSMRFYARSMIFICLFYARFIQERVRVCSSKVTPPTTSTTSTATTTGIYPPTTHHSPLTTYHPPPPPPTSYHHHQVHRGDVVRGARWPVRSSTPFCLCLQTAWPIICPTVCPTVWFHPGW
jgi:hypothetical protein